MFDSLLFYGYWGPVVYAELCLAGEKYFGSSITPAHAVGYNMKALLVAPLIWLTGTCGSPFFSSVESILQLDELLLGRPRYKRDMGFFKILIEPSGSSTMQVQSISWSRFNMSFSNSN